MLPYQIYRSHRKRFDGSSPYSKKADHHLNFFRMCFGSFNRADREEDVIVIPNRPVPASQRQSCILPISAPSNSGHNLSTLQSPRSQLLSIEHPSSQSPKEIRELNSSGRLVAVKTITPRSSNPAVHQHEPRRSGGNLSHKGDLGSARHSTTVIITPRHSETVVISPRRSGNVAQGSVINTRPPIRSRRQSAISYRSPRQSTTSVRSVSHRSVREKMAEVDEGGVRRDYDRRDDSRR